MNSLTTNRLNFFANHCQLFTRSRAVIIIRLFFNKGKLRPFNKLKKSEAHQEALASLHDFEIDDLHTIFEGLEGFVCDIYGFKRKKTSQFGVNKFRFEIFSKNYQVKKIDEPFTKKNLKKFDASCLPPCKRELYQHLLRTFFITKLWMNADKKQPLANTHSFDTRENSRMVPENFGWTLNQEINCYEFKWFEGLQLPERVKDMIVDSDGEND